MPFRKYNVIPFLWISVGLKRFSYNQKTVELRHEFLGWARRSFAEEHRPPKIRSSSLGFEEWGPNWGPPRDRQGLVIRAASCYLHQSQAAPHFCHLLTHTHPTPTQSPSSPRQCCLAPPTTPCSWVLYCKNIFWVWKGLGTWFSLLISFASISRTGPAFLDTQNSGGGKGGTKRNPASSAAPLSWPMSLLPLSPTYTMWPSHIPPILGRAAQDWLDASIFFWGLSQSFTHTPYLFLFLGNFS